MVQMLVTHVSVQGCMKWRGIQSWNIDNIMKHPGDTTTAALSTQRKVFTGSCQLVTRLT